MKIAPRLALLILLGTGAILALVSLSDYFTARRMLEEELRAKATNLARATAADMEIIKRAVEKVVDEMAIVLEMEPFALERVYLLLENTLRQHEELFGSAVTLSPSPRRSGGDRVIIPYVFQDGAGFARKDLADGDYPFMTFDWYMLPRELREPIWTEPYYDEGGGDSIMVTYSVPMFAAVDGRFEGIVTGDLSLDWLKSMLASMDLGEGGYAFLLSRNGTVVSHPQAEFIMCESVFSVAEEYENEEMRRIGQRMVRGEAGFVEFTRLQDDEPFWMAYTPVKGTGWSLAALFPQKQITAKVFALSRMKFVLGVLGMIAMAVVAAVIAHSISRPIRELDGAAQTLAGGNLEAQLPAPRGRDEIAALTESFARMQRDLKRHIEELKVTTAAKARMESDLETARTIQLDLLPSRFTFDPPRPEAEVFAMLEAARAVGGDFYDFFPCGRDRLFLAVGDVSGKGVPASLFMAVSKAYLKAFVKEGLEPPEALAHLNDELAIENDEGMFLTVFCCIVDLATGACTYANGGHNPPFVLRRSGRVEAVPDVKGPLIGIYEGRSFEAGTLTLGRGDLLLTYSDGVVEAENAEQAFYGEERTAEVLARLGGRPVEDVLRAVREDVRQFAAGAPQSDDITLLGVRYQGVGPR
jgi:sigma-B regulation protein RsbU (phosphoserine phosphatase)